MMLLTGLVPANTASQPRTCRQVTGLMRLVQWHLAGTRSAGAQTAGETMQRHCGELHTCGIWANRWVVNAAHLAGTSE